MTFVPQAIPDVLLITPRVFSDSRGFFMETFQAATLRQAGLPVDFAQDNESCSRRGVLRGLHYQLSPQAQGKLVRVARGRVWDSADRAARRAASRIRCPAQNQSEVPPVEAWTPGRFP